MPAISQKTQSEIDVNLAEAESYRIEAAREQIMLEENVYTTQIARSGDFRNGYILISEMLDDEVCERYASWVRQFNRAFDPLIPLTLVLSTPGGDILSSLGLYDEIREVAKSRKVITVVRGMTASMGSVLLQAGDVRKCGRQSRVMIHKAQSGSQGFSFEIEDQLEFLKDLENQIVSIYVERSGTPREVFDKELSRRKDVWLSADRALELGLIDEIA